MIKVESVDFKYEDGNMALKNVSINLDKGKVIGIIGSNGSGKSTLFLNILGILKPTKGKIYFNNKPIQYDKKSLRDYRTMVTMVFQDPDKQLFYSRVYDDMAFPLRNLGIPEEAIKEKVESTLDKVKALDLMEKPTHFLSYGQKKRISIGGALIMDSEVLLLDEPTSGLDPAMSKEVINIIRDLSREKKLVVSSHNMDFIYEICDYIYIISKGEILGEGIPEEMFLKEDILEESGLNKPWLVKIHQYLNQPLYKNEDELFQNTKPKGDNMKKGIIVTSFGTSHNETRELCIESIENRIKEKYSDYLVTRAFTSRMVINKLKKRDNYLVDTPTEALNRMRENGIKEIYVQPLLIIEGHEYEKTLKEIDKFVKENPDFKVTVAKPLLSDEMDYENTVKGLGLDKENAVVFMGHGSDHITDISYKKLEDTIRKNGYKNVFIGTVEGSVGIDDVVEKLKEKSIKKVILKPFMLVAGVHALEDMASESQESWKSILEKNGIDVEVQIVGLGQVKAFQDIFIEHLDRIGDE